MAVLYIYKRIKVEHVPKKQKVRSQMPTRVESLLERVFRYQKSTDEKYQKPGGETKLLIISKLYNSLIISEKYSIGYVV